MFSNMIVGQRVYIRDKRHLLHGNVGKVTNYRPSDGPWTPDRVSVNLDGGQRCVVEPAEITIENKSLNKRQAR